MSRLPARPRGQTAPWWKAGAPLRGALTAALGGVVAPIWLAVVLLPERAAPLAPDIGALEQRFAERGYSLAAVTQSEAPVPRLFLETLPDDWSGVRALERRKELFLLTTLPLVLQENERILADRRRLRALRDRIEAGGRTAPHDRTWLERLAERYRGDPEDLADLVRRVDAVPVSLALAQAALESGWGTSRFAGEGNALFGHWTEEGENAMTPLRREPGRRHGVRRFATLGHSVAAYMANLNRHPAYRAFRQQRAELRRLGRRLSGVALAATLAPYSERGAEYVSVLRRILVQNALARFDSARLAARPGEVAPPDEG